MGTDKTCVKEKQEMWKFKKEKYEEKICAKKIKKRKRSTEIEDGKIKKNIRRKKPAQRR